MSHSPAIAIEALSYHYPDGTPGLSDLSLVVAPGENVAILGANGAGKSTLLLNLNGLLQGQGHVAINGLPVTKPHLQEIRRHVGLVFQNPDDQLFCPTVYEDIAFGPRNLKLPEEQIPTTVSECLRAVGLDDHYARRNCFHLSMGEKKRVALAAVLAMNPSILAIDEPTGGLDPRGRRELIGLLTRLGRTQLIVTHDLPLAESLCVRGVVLHQGQKVADGPLKTLLADQAFLEKYGLK